MRASARSPVLSLAGRRGSAMVSISCCQRVSSKPEAADARSLARFSQPGSIARQHIDFEVNRIAWAKCPKRGHFQRMRNDKDRESIALHRIHRERNTVEGR